MGWIKKELKAVQGTTTNVVYKESELVMICKAAGTKLKLIQRTESLLYVPIRETRVQ
jgi:hypothetical protein